MVRVIDDDTSPPIWQHMWGAVTVGACCVLSIVPEGLGCGP